MSVKLELLEGRDDAAADEDDDEVLDSEDNDDSGDGTDVNGSLLISLNMVPNTGCT